jgi:beta-glucanase (GH16 family)
MPRNIFARPCWRWRRAPAIAAIIVTTALFVSACGTARGESDAANSTQSSTPPSPTPKPTYEPTGAAGKWELIFDDEFNGTGLDTSKWSTGWLASGITGPVNSWEKECYDPAQVTESGGALNLSLITKTESCGTADPEYASGLVNTSGKFSYTYGFLQARVWLPAKTGDPSQVADWPAVWTDGQNWPADGEDDVMEGINGRACAHFHSAVSPGGVAPADGTSTVAVKSGCAKEILTGGWHTFGANWEPGSVTYYYDGKDIGSVTSGVTSAPMFLILDYAAGPPYQSPSTMKVDYVRVWQKAGN